MTLPSIGSKDEPTTWPDSRAASTRTRPGRRPRSTTDGALGEGGRRPPHQLGGAGLRQEPAEGVLGVDPGLDRVPLDGDVLLGEAERLAGGHAELQLDQVDALAADPHDLLGDGVLDLEAGVHLEEVHVARVTVEQELDRARVGVADRLRQGDGAAGDRRALGVGDRGGGRLLEHLLVAALGRAVALEEVHHVAVVVGEHLDLDVATVLDVLLDEEGVVAERAQRLAARGGQRGVVLAARTDDAHALAAATGRGLDAARGRRSRPGRRRGRTTARPARPRPRRSRGRRPSCPSRPSRRRRARRGGPPRCPRSRGRRRTAPTGSRSRGGSPRHRCAGRRRRSRRCRGSRAARGPRRPPARAGRRGRGR